MELAELTPFLFVLSSTNFKAHYTEVSLDDFESLLSDPPLNPDLKLCVDRALESFPHKTYIPLSYFLKAPDMQYFDPPSIIYFLVCIKGLTPIFNKSGLCFLFNNKSKLVKLADIVKENEYSMCGEVLQIASDVKRARIGEDLIVNLTNGLEKIYKNTSENYLKLVGEGKKPKKKGLSICSIISKPSKQILRDISNSGN